MSKKKSVIGTVCCIGVLSIGLGYTNSYNIKQEKQEQIRIEKIKKEKEQERIAKEKEEKEKEELKRKQEEEKRKAEELKAAQEAERLAAEQAAKQAAQEAAEQAAQQAIVEENNVQENYVAEEAVQNNEYAVAANTQTSASYEDFMVMGVVYSNGYKYTYYSQRV